MHELSLASALLDLARRYVPPGARLTRVSVRAGPMRAIDAEVMTFAWHSALAAARLPDADLRLQSLPWTLHCPFCHNTHTSPTPDDLCPHCSHPGGTPVGGDELELTSIEVDSPRAKGACP